MFLLVGFAQPLRSSLEIAPFRATIGCIEDRDEQIGKPEGKRLGWSSLLLRVSQGLKILSLCVQQSRFEFLKGWRMNGFSLIYIICFGCCISKFSFLFELKIIALWILDLFRSVDNLDYKKFFENLIYQGLSKNSSLYIWIYLIIYYII